MTKTILTIIALSTILLTSLVATINIQSAYAVPTNLVTNGSFESISASCTSSFPAFVTLFSPSTAITGWNITSGSVDVNCGWWTNSDGSQSLDLSGNGPGSISQDIATVPGTTYDVTFDMAGNPDPNFPPAIKNMTVDASGTSQVFSFDTSGKTKTNMGWVQKSFQFTATGTITTLTFTSNVADAFGPALDNVSVTPAAPVITSPEIITLRSDSSHTYLVSPTPGKPFPTVFTAADFTAARSGPNAYEIPNHNAWKPHLSVDPTGTYIGNANVNPNSIGPNSQLVSTLYAIDFVVTSPTVSSATLDFYYLVDNQLGWLAGQGFGGATNEGIFINGQPVVGTTLPISICGFCSEHSFTGLDISGLVHPGTNTLYVYAADYGQPQGLQYLANISITSTPVDNVPPTVTVSSETSEATGPNGASVSFTATATDDVDGSITPTCDATSGDTFPLGTTIVTCTATDAAGNTGNGTGTITVQDTTAPSITAPADVTVEATGAQTIVSIGTATATDAVGPVTITSDAPADFPLGSTTVIWTATDGAGNISTASQIITVQDTTAPVITVSLDEITSEEDEGIFRVTITATDAVDPNPSIAAEINGIPVTNGQLVKLDIDDESESKFKEAKEKQCTKYQEKADKKLAEGKPIKPELEAKLLICEAGGVLQIEDSSFTLTATATDGAGNSSTATTIPTFTTEVDDDNEDHDDDDKKSKDKKKDKKHDDDD